MIVFLRGRKMRTVSMVSAGIAFASAAAFAGQLPMETVIALWRPIEKFGSSFMFAVDSGIWPILLLASAAALAEAVLDGRSSVRLLYSGLALAAIAGGNLLTITMLWTVMILLETALRLGISIELEVAIRKAAVQFAAVAAVLAAISLSGSAVLLLALAALFRSVGGVDERFRFSLAIMPALGALALISQSIPDESMPLWIAAAGIAAGFAIARSWPALSQALLPARPLLEKISQVGRIVSEILGTSVRTIADVLEGESAVLWILLVLLIVIVGLRAVIT
jgi:hypothetical protein